MCSEVRLSSSYPETNSTEFLSFLLKTHIQQQLDQLPGVQDPGKYFYLGISSERTSVFLPDPSGPLDTLDLEAVNKMVSASLGEYSLISYY